MILIHDSLIIRASIALKPVGESIIFQQAVMVHSRWCQVCRAHRSSFRRQCSICRRKVPLGCPEQCMWEMDPMVCRPCAEARLHAQLKMLSRQCLKVLTWVVTRPQLSLTHTKTRQQRQPNDTNNNADNKNMLVCYTIAILPPARETMKSFRPTWFHENLM